MSLDPLFDLRIRTPRLELRLPTEAELEDLYHLAAEGIHPPEEMPFGIAWTDELTLGSFLGYHRWRRESWKPESWSLELGTWADGTLSGVQAIHAEDFAATRQIGTGSWLGRRFQRRGIGTEMRTAVVEFAFRDLGATAVTSSAFEANVASRGVSEKLGYGIVGRELISPRGEPKPHLLLRLDRSGWRGAPFEVAVEGLEPCLPLLGL